MAVCPLPLCYLTVSAVYAQTCLNCCEMFLLYTIISLFERLFLFKKFLLFVHTFDTFSPYTVLTLLERVMKPLFQVYNLKLQSFFILIPGGCKATRPPRRFYGVWEGRGSETDIILPAPLYRGRSSPFYRHNPPLFCIVRAGVLSF